MPRYSSYSFNCWFCIRHTRDCIACELESVNRLIDYFKKVNLQETVYKPLNITKRQNEFDVRCLVKGGGLSGQAGAIVHGISRALIEYEPTLKSTLKKEKLTTRDSRSVERKKYGHRKARRSFHFSKR